jgi:glycosyltransferase involved in cell wall biosynthesis
MPVRAVSDPKVSIVVPARNEARNLEVILPRLPEVHEVILVDGRSVDGTVETARRVMPSIKVVHQTRRGKGNALVCGFAAVTGDIVVMLDADGSADPAEIPAFVAALVAGADVAKGTRFAAGGGSEDITRFRALGNHGLNLVTNLMLGTAYTDLCYGYNAFWADLLPALELPAVDTPVRIDGQMEWGDGFEIETVLNCRFAAARMRVTEVGSVERLRIYGRSNLNAVSDGLRVLRTIWTEKQRSSRAGITRALIRSAHATAA